MPVLLVGAFELVAFVVAIMALLLLIAGHHIIGILKSILGRVPLIGGYLGSIAVAWVTDAMKAYEAAYQEAVRPVAHFLWAIGVGVWHFAYNVVVTIEDAKTWATNAMAAAIAANNAIWPAVQSGVASAFAAAQGLVASAYSSLAHLIDQTATNAAAGTAAAEALAHSLADQVSSEAATLFGQAEAAATAQVQQAEALAQGLADSVQSEAVRLFGQAETAIGVLQQDVLGIPAEITGVIDGTVPGLITGAIAGAIPGILAQVIPRVAALEAEATTCLEPLCDTVTPNAKQLGDLGKLLKDLEGLAAAGALMGLLVAAVEAPAGTARVVVDATSWVDTLATDLVDVVGSAAGVNLR